MIPRFPHQDAALAWAHGRNAMLFYGGMGVGKSRIAIDLITQEQYRRALIVAPKAVASDVWAEQIAKFNPDINILSSMSKKHVSTKEWADILRKRKGEPGVFVINYDVVNRQPLIGALINGDWDCVIADEIHRIKQPGGKQSWAMAAIGKKSPSRVGLTGTPIPHDEMDVYAQFRFLDSSIFGTNFISYKARYAEMEQVSIGWGPGKKLIDKFIGLRNAEEWREKFDSITFRMPRSLLVLPEAIHVTRKCQFRPETAQLYDKLERELCALLHVSNIEGAVDKVEAGEVVGEMSIPNALVKIMRLHQCAQGVVSDDDGTKHLVDNCKIDLLKDVMEDIDKDEPVVIFCRFTSDIERIKSIIPEAGILDGSRNDISAWKAGQHRTLICQIQSGSMGIDLTRAAVCIYFSIDFNAGTYLQSLARVHRPGQTRAVTYVHLVTEGTVDTVVQRSVLRRSARSNALQGGQDESISGQVGRERAGGYRADATISESDRFVGS